MRNCLEGSICIPFLWPFKLLQIVTCGVHKESQVTRLWPAIKEKKIVTIQWSPKLVWQLKIIKIAWICRCSLDSSAFTLYISLEGSRARQICSSGWAEGVYWTCHDPMARFLRWSCPFHHRVSRGSHFLTRRIRSMTMIVTCRHNLAFFSLRLQPSFAVKLMLAFTPSVRNAVPASLVNCICKTVLDNLWSTLLVKDLWTAPSLEASIASADTGHVVSVIYYPGQKNWNRHASQTYRRVHAW